MILSQIDIATQNKRKYLKAPSWVKINSFIKKCGVSESHFELFFGMPKGTIKVYRFGNRKLPSQYWHIFFDKETIKQKMKRYTTKKTKTPLVKERADNSETEKSNRLKMLLSEAR